MPVIKDRRSSPRVEIEGRARVLTERDRFEGWGLDLGLGGLAIRSTRAARPHDPVTIELLVDDQQLRLEAVVARRQRERGDYVLGFAFVDLDLDAQRRLEHIVFERMAGSPLADFLRAFAAHTERVPPPPATHPLTTEGTVVVGAVPGPVITGHTQVVAVGMLPMVDRTVITLPSRTETVLADAPSAAGSAPDRTEPVDALRAPGVPDEAWLDDEMDTEQFRLLEAAQAREATERGEPLAALALEAELDVLESDDAVPDHTVVVRGFSRPTADRPPRESTPSKATRARASRASRPPPWWAPRAR